MGGLHRLPGYRTWSHTAVSIERRRQATGRRAHPAAMPAAARQGPHESRIALFVHMCAPLRVPRPQMLTERTRFSVAATYSGPDSRKNVKSNAQKRTGNGYTIVNSLYRYTMYYRHCEPSRDASPVSPQPHPGRPALTGPHPSPAKDFATVGHRRTRENDRMIRTDHCHRKRTRHSAQTATHVRAREPGGSD